MIVNKTSIKISHRRNLLLNINILQNYFY